MPTILDAAQRRAGVRLIWISFPPRIGAINDPTQDLARDESFRMTDDPFGKNACRRVGPVACRNCDLNAICRLTGLIAYDGGRPKQSTGRLRTLRAGAALYSVGQAAGALFAVREGMIKLVRLNAEGDERIVSFHTPGEVIGLEAFGTGAYSSDAVALGNVQCCELPVPPLNDESPRTAAVAAQLVHLLSRAAAVQPAFSRGSARQRVTEFLLDLARRMRARGFDGSELRLSMSRLDIANLLDTRIETVSRMLQELSRERVIHVRGNRVRLLSLEAVGDAVSEQYA